MQPINFGIIGAGRIGRVHAESLTQRIPGAQVSAVSDVILEAAQSCGRDFNIPNAYADHRTLLEDPAIDAVIICSSTDTHTQMIVEAAEAGKQIFCEKPIALDLAAIDRALATVERCGVKLQIGFNRRFDSNFRHIRDTVASGGIGTPQLVRITSRDPAPPPLSYLKVSGGIFLDMTIHDFDMARYLINDEVVEVYAAADALVDPAIGEIGDVDTAVITLRYAGGAIGVIDNSRKAVYGYDQRAEVLGSAGAIESQHKTAYNTVHSTANGLVAANPLYFFLERYMDSYTAELRAFMTAIQNNTPTPVTGLDGRIPVVIGLAAWQSVREHRPVRISEIGV